MKQVEPGCQPVSGPRLDIACEQHHHTRSFCHDAAQHESTRLRVPALVVSCVCDYRFTGINRWPTYCTAHGVRLGIQMLSLTSYWTLVFAEDASGFNVTCSVVGCVYWERVRNLLSLSPFRLRMEDKQPS